MGQLIKISNHSSVISSHFSINKIILFLAVLMLPKIIIAQITYNDIASINTLQSFQRVVIENNFELLPTGYDTIPTYSLNLMSDGRYEQTAFYNPESTAFYFFFVLNDSSISERSPFFNIMEEIKSSCSFYKIIDNFACYSCPQSGKIGFKMMELNTDPCGFNPVSRELGIIRHFPNE